MVLSEGLLRRDSSARVGYSPRMEDVVGHVCSGMLSCHQPSTGQTATACLTHQEGESCWA